MIEHIDPELAEYVSDNNACVARLMALTDEWQSVNFTTIATRDSVALYLLCQAGLAEMELKGRAWTEVAAVEIEAIVAGRWSHPKGNILPDVVRRAIPAWKDRPVSVQVSSASRIRLTRHGQRTKADIESHPEGMYMLAMYAASHPVKGRAGVRIIGDETTPPGGLATTGKDQVIKRQVKAATQNALNTKAMAKVGWLSMAMLIVNEHPNWSDAQIARATQKHPATLSRNETYKIAARQARSAGTKPTPGFTTTDPDSGDQDVVAVDPDSTEPDDHADIGKKIPGSRFYREYCSECGDAIGVPQAEVGKNPVCAACRR